MSVKNFFERYCLEYDITTTSSKALNSNKFHNNPEKIVMIYESLQASIERLNQACERMGITVNTAIAQYEQLRLQREINRIAVIKNRAEQKKEIAHVAAITRNSQKSSKGAAIV